MKKKILCIFITLFVFLMTTNVFAAPDMLSLDVESTTDGLIKVTNPEGSEVNTSEDSFLLSGRGKDGVIITLYEYVSNMDRYMKVMVECDITDFDYPPESTFEDDEVEDEPIVIVTEDEPENEQDSEEQSEQQAEQQTENSETLYSNSINEGYFTDLEQESYSEQPVEWSVGASGIFNEEVSLEEGENNFLLRAAMNEESYQIVKINITRLNEKFVQDIKDMEVDVTSEGINQIIKEPAQDENQQLNKEDTLNINMQEDTNQLEIGSNTP